MRVVLDCNVLVSASLTNGTCRTCITYAANMGEIIVTPAMLLEYYGVMKKKKLYKAAQTLYQIINAIELSAIHIEDMALREIILPDKSDEIYAHAAIAGSAQYLITGNSKHFPEPQYGKTQVINPRQFLELIHE